MSCDIEDILILLPNLGEENTALITSAYDFAKTAHENQKRKSGEPYFIHVFETAKILAQYKMDAKTIVAGFLHDVIEDTPHTYQEVSEKFGEDVALMVNGVTKLGSVEYKGHIRHAESLRKLLMATAHDARVLIIKLADRLHNLRTLEFMPPHKQVSIAQESIEIYAPLADRLGMGRLKSEIEDAAFPYAFPKEYEETKVILDNRKEKIQVSFEIIRNEIETKFAKAGIKVIKLEHRIKHAYSLWRKLQRHEMSIEKIYDLAAFRVIVSNIEECYASMGIIHSLWQPIPGRIKDYIATPKFNGYQSIHTTVLVDHGNIIEFQIRTKEMDGNAAYGFAAHFQYKENPNQKSIDNKFNWINEFKDLENGEKEPSSFVNQLKADFFNDQIFIFTPQGDVVDMPTGSTALDFAYYLHSKIGDKAVSSNINGKESPLSTPLESWNVVEIVTDENSHPQEKWLAFVKTNVAKRKIKDYVNSKNSHGYFDKFFSKTK